MTRSCLIVFLWFAMSLSARSSFIGSELPFAGVDSWDYTPDTVDVAVYMAVIDSLVQMGEKHQHAEREIAMQRAAQQQMIQRMRYIHLGDEFELGPVTRLVMRNSVDGFRTRVGGRTTAELHPRLFWQGYVSRGFKSEQNYFNSQITYSFNRKNYQPTDYPQRTVSWQAMRETGMPYEIFRGSSDDGFLSSLRWTSVDQMIRYNRQQVELCYDWNRHLKNSLQLSASSIATVGNWDEPSAKLAVNRLHIADVTLQMSICPIAHSAITLSHRIGMSGFLRGDYNYNITTLNYCGTFDTGRDGRLDIDAEVGMEWNEVPFLLLCMPAANMSYVAEKATFMLVNNYEFANDRYAHLMFNWDLGGVLLSRGSLFRQLGCHEFIGVRTLWGTVSDKNNHGISVMNGSIPYCECSVGVGRILGFISLEYVRRLNYLGSSGVYKQGFRIGFDF